MYPTIVADKIAPELNLFSPCGLNRLTSVGRGERVEWREDIVGFHLEENSGFVFRVVKVDVVRAVNLLQRITREQQKEMVNWRTVTSENTLWGETMLQDECLRVRLIGD